MMVKVSLTYSMKIILAVSCLPNRDIERINEDLGATLFVAIEMHSEVGRSKRCVKCSTFQPVADYNGKTECLFAWRSPMD